MAVTAQDCFFWNVTPCSLVHRYQQKFSGFNSSCWSVGLLEGLYSTWWDVRSEISNGRTASSVGVNKDAEAVGRKVCVGYMRELEDIWSILAMGLGWKEG